MTGLKKNDTERERLVRQVSKHEKIIQDAFLAFVAVVKSDEILRTVNNLLEAGNIEGALDIVDTHIVRFASILTTTFVAAGNEATVGLAATLGTAGIGVSFDPTDERSVNIMRNNKLQFIREASDQQKAATRQALTRAFEEGAGPRQTATALKNSLGLTSKQELAVQRYKGLLEKNSKQALDRNLRDRRFDRTVAAAVRNDEPLSSKQIDRMVTRYRERFIQFRAEVVARTEGVKVASQARQEALRQLTEEADIEDSRVERTWNPTPGIRTRDHHASMKKQKVRGIDSFFTDGNGNQLQFPGDPSAPLDTIAQCRCVLTFRIIGKVV